ncbi:MAG: protein kinase [Myxococcales bacterium]|nr:protein kinase [Myxococcales bacterium]MDH3483294.1 protein kinase [Myxococcales bacterium]
MEEAAGEHDPLIGATLGGLYRVERLIGEGGMGRVYEATHAHLGRAYAVKVLGEGRADKPGAVARFLREAKSANRIEHEHIVKVVNFDEHDEHGVFIVMELLEGENLAERLERGPLPVDEAVELATQTGDALEAAHETGIVHRDLKPENIFITQKKGRDFVKVLDFGISKIKSPDHTDIKLTATDQIVGTPLYISPELARGVSTIDHRTDIYALGVIVYEMITGTPPFSGQNHFQLLYKHGNEAPDPPSQRSPRAKIPTHVEAAVLRALEKKPADRFSTMKEFCDALQGPSPQYRQRSIVVAVLAAVAVALAVVLWPAGEARAPIPEPGAAPVARSPIPTPVTPTPEEPAEISEAASPAALVRLQLNSAPRGASVAVDGRKKGETPLTLELPRGSEATVRFSLEGYQPKEHRLIVEDDETVNVRLRKRIRRQPPPIKENF